MTSDPTAPPAEVSCEACDGRADRHDRVSHEDGNVIYHYRCKDECRSGGHVVVDRSSGVVTRRAGPVFDGRPTSSRPGDRDDEPVLIADGGPSLNFGDAIVERNEEQLLVSASNDEVGIRVAIAVDSSVEGPMLHGGELHRRLSEVVDLLTEDVPDLVECEECEGVYAESFVREVIRDTGSTDDLCPHCRAELFEAETAVDGGTVGSRGGEDGG